MDSYSTDATIHVQGSMACQVHAGCHRSTAVAVAHTCTTTNARDSCVRPRNIYIVQRIDPEANTYT